ncbi:MAG: hypothetical protein IJT96_06185 [Lachnospiraceae bacterium]|nr:hypothetical protein [Lachnospiraceae bacterium]
MWIENVEAELGNIYGSVKAKQVVMNIIPSCVSDFRRMLEAANRGERVTETYKTEDKLAELLFIGEKRIDGLCLTDVSVNGNKVVSGDWLL